jgi:hypothetical protein
MSVGLQLDSDPLMGLGQVRLASLLLWSLILLAGTLLHSTT